MEQLVTKEDFLKFFHKAEALLISLKNVPLLKKGPLEKPHEKAAREAVERNVLNSCSQLPASNPREKSPWSLSQSYPAETFAPP